MEELEEQFVPYKEALALKELGFDEECVGLFSLMITVKKVGGKLTHTIDEPRTTDFSLVHDPKTNSDYNFSNLIDTITTPLYQQAFEWFRKGHGLHSFIDIYPTNEEPDRCWFMIRYMDREEGDKDYMSGWYSNNKDAESGCLRKLIEIAKEEDI